MSESIQAFRYRAFISYSHADEAIAARLHRQLERYRPPRGLKQGGESKALARIHPVFRDRDELAGAGQLSDAIAAALDESEALIVVCSPTAVASRWVGEEIRRFRQHHPERQVLAFVASGDPAANPRERPDEAAFPLPLLLLDPGDNDSSLLEPLAADSRAEGDGFHAAFLKLVAGLLGVGLDQLRQRDLHRRQRFWFLTAATSILLSACFAGLAWQATRARDAAREAQAQAELELTSERQTRDFLLSVFELADAGKSRGNQITVREVLDRAVARIDVTTFERPAIKSRFLSTMGQAYNSLGINQRAADLLRESLQELPAADNSIEANSQRNDSRLELADVLFSAGDYPAAINALDEMDAATPTQQAYAAVIRGDILTYMEQDEQAELTFKRALRAIDIAGGNIRREDESLIRSRALSGLALIQMYANGFSKADDYYREALAALLPVFGEYHPASLVTKYSRASNSYLAGDIKTAKREWEQSLAVANRLYDPLSPEIGTLKNNLGRLALETDDLTSAESMLNDAVASDRKFRTEGFDDLAYPLNSLAMVKLAQGDPESARKLLAEAQSIAEAANHPILGAVLTHVADLDCEADPSPEALAMAQRGLDTSSAREDTPEWRIAEARLTLTYCRHRLGQQDADRNQTRADVETIRKQFPTENLFTRRAEAQLHALQSRP